jgi:hypothetical protein
VYIQFNNSPELESKVSWNNRKATWGALRPLLKAVVTARLWLL